ncbi:MAG: DNA-binding protein [Alphaproteobacteria bacterium]|nr:MAG: DNA-binding protein [Alphaproteobacteria bacterium]
MPREQERKAAYKIPEAAALLSISVSQFYRLMELAQIDTIKIGGCRRVTWHQIESFLRRQEG